MITSLQEFTDNISHELYALETVAPLASLGAPPGPGGRHDLRTNTATIAVSGSLLDWIGGPSCARRLEALERSIKPLAFGAAWKVIDLLIEYSLGGMSMRIGEKARLASSGKCPPLSDDVAVWHCLAKLYSGTMEARHCLVHRRFRVGPAGELTDFVDKNGDPIDGNVTAAEQQAFCRLAQRFADAVITGAMSPRMRGDIAGLLNALAAHHREPLLPGEQVRDVRVIVGDAMRTADGWVLHVTDLLDSLQQRYPPGTLFDLELHFPDTPNPPLRCELDQAPPGTHGIDPTAPPSWLSLAR